MDSQSSTASLPEPRGVSAANHSGRGFTPEWPARILILAAVLGVCDRSYWLYSNTDRYWPTYWMPFIHGTELAPEQYRIGVKLAAWWLVQHLHWGFRHGFALMDVAAAVPGILLLYDVLINKRWYRSASIELRALASAVFVLLTCFYLAWIESYFRPETLPTTGLIALMAWLWSRRDSAPPRPSREALIIAALLAATAVQATIRADVVCILSAGMLVASIARWDPALALRRPLAILTSATCGLLAAAIQLYIMKVLYPHASYGPIPVLMVLHDLQQPLGFPPFLCFIVPFAWTVVRFWRHRPPRDAASAGLLLAGILYLVLWIVMGKLDEVRIFVPFALALAPLTAELAIRAIRHDSPAPAGRANA